MDTLVKIWEMEWVPLGSHSRVNHSPHQVRNLQFLKIHEKFYLTHGHPVFAVLLFHHFVKSFYSANLCLIYLINMSFNIFLGYKQNSLLSVCYGFLTGWWFQPNLKNISSLSRGENTKPPPSLVSFCFCQVHHKT